MSTEYHHLLGADDVVKGGYACERAAAEMKRAAESIDESLRNHQSFLRDWLAEYRDVTERGAVTHKPY